MLPSFTVGVQILHEGKSLNGLNAGIRERTEAFKLRRRLAAFPTATARPLPDVPPMDSAGISGAPDPLAVSEVQEPSLPIPVAPTPIGWNDIRNEVEALGNLTAELKLKVFCKSTLRNKPSPGEKIEPEIEFMNSFYLEDLDRLIVQADTAKLFGAALNRYLGPASEGLRRQDLLTRDEVMRGAISPARMPQGRWPTKKKNHLMLAQQAAVGEICAQLHTGAGLLSVNGPPGTGKTTLLCDVIADIVVQRAKALAKLSRPGDVFGAKTMIGGIPFYPLLPAVVAGTGIVVTSNNNAAVKNITLELPALAKIAGDEYEQAGYFRDVAQNVLNTDESKPIAWGLIAGALGNKVNRRNFANAFFVNRSGDYRPGTPCDIKTILEAQNEVAALSAWHQAKDTFCSLLMQVEKVQSRFAEAEAALNRLPVAQAQVDSLSVGIDIIKKDSIVRLAGCDDRMQKATASLGETHIASQSADSAAATCKLQMDAASDLLSAAEANNPPRIWDRLLHTFAVETVRMRTWHALTTKARTHRAKRTQALAEALTHQAQWTGKLTASRKALDQCHQDRLAEIARAQRADDEATRTLMEVQKTVLTYNGCLDTLRQEGVVIPDDAFFAQPVTTRHLASAWVTPAVDDLRAKLLLAALRLHETTLLACKNKAIPNLRAVNLMLLNGLPEPVADVDRSVLWNMLFFVVPVVSTTLASFDRLFAGVGQEELGWLLIDEAGQATPQSVAGALWRSQRAVIVGDPLQVEPVVTVPSAVIAGLRELNGVGTCWSPLQASAQTVADRTMELGAYISHIAEGGTNENAVWTGLPLRAHRRCIDPMFDVANRIAYQGQMVQANLAPAELNCILGESAWIDVRNQKADGPVVRGEINALADLLDLLKQHWPTYGAAAKSATIYVISPFRKVAQACAGLITKAQLDAKVQTIDSGTVHRFQGKEAEIVFIVLGSASEKAGEGSRHWASAKPNLLNVALTRAKLRVFLIGNAQEWGSCAGFRELLEAFQATGRVVQAGPFYEAICKTVDGLAPQTVIAHQKVNLAPGFR